MFKKILIANRGAIATRAERTFRAMGIESVAVYNEADRESLHVTGADTAVSLGEGSVAETYLDQDKLIDAARETGAEAVFPGYGFLSENEDFARRCADEGVVFIGPEPEQMHQFGLKHIARELAVAAGVPLAPGTGLIDDVEEAVREAERIGYPVMLKSTAGGGGIGISICESEDELRAAFDSSRHLAAQNFGNSGVFLERYVQHARHVEVQIFGANGTVRALGERDCSVQRRNQKVVEECPAPRFPEQVRRKMLAAAESLGNSVGYRSAGTVEFLYDEEREEFYFLEVNTRLQVEHGITEECCGVDLVEWMVREAAGEPIDFSVLDGQHGHAIEVRLYAEDPKRGFSPSTGKIDDVEFGEGARVETWITKGTEVSPLFDPMLAKIIVHADTREAAVEKMHRVLSETRVYGITTNLLYIQSLFESEAYRTARLSTHMLDGFSPAEPTIEVVDGGVQSTVQDYPGYTGYWAVGVPPCGPMDSYSFRVGNAILGNPEDAAGIEFTLRGGTYVFRSNARFVLAGADMQARLDGESCPRYQAVLASAGAKLELGSCTEGMRGYLLVEGGFDVAKVLGSSSTFVDGKFGGHGGRPLRAGDVIRLNVPASAGAAHSVLAVDAGAIPAFGDTWELGVLVGPHSDGEFLKPAYLEQLTSSEYTVNYDSARTGVRLNGPAPLWAREDGGEAGLHPSNIHDCPYSICALDLTGDQPILLGPDGPSLGGFVCPVVVATGQRWVLGQMKPGDRVHFVLMDADDAADLRHREDETIEALRSAARAGQARFAKPIAAPVPETSAGLGPDSCFLYTKGSGDERMCIRQSGEDAVLVEYGPMKLDIALRFRVHVLMKSLAESDLPVEDLTPGIRSLQVHFDPDRVSQGTVVEAIVAADEALPELDDITVPSRIVHLPLSWDDPQTQLAARRYQETTRPDAPWCPSNPEFIRRINGLDSIDDVRDIVFKAKYLVLGLGDVYLGAPVATPIDPRQRLVTTKYNPARPWTPENAVGIGGAYLCVYGMEGPGGYQFVGRTTQMWNPLKPTESFKPGKPWLLDFFDQIVFYPVSADEILRLRDDCLHGRFNVEIEETTFSLSDYRKFLDENASSIAQFKEHQEAAFQAEHDRWVRDGLDTFVPDEPTPAFADTEVPGGCQAVTASIAGSVWKVQVQEGEQVEEGQRLVTLESMKMEFGIDAPAAGTVEKVLTEPGTLVMPGTNVVWLRTE